MVQKLSGKISLHITNAKMRPKKKKAFDTVKVFSAIKEKIAKETGRMTFAEFKEYLKKNQLGTF